MTITVSDCSEASNRSAFSSRAYPENDSFVHSSSTVNSRAWTTSKASGAISWMLSQPVSKNIFVSSDTPADASSYYFLLYRTPEKDDR